MHVMTCQPSAAISGFNTPGQYSTKVWRTTQRTGNRNREHLRHNWMIGADDGTSVGDSKNLLLDKAEFFVVRRILEQLSGRSDDVGLMISGSMGMTRSNFNAQSFYGICLQVLGPGCKSVPVYVNTSFADCKESENLDHFIASYCIVPSQSLSQVGNDSGNQIFLNIKNVSLAMLCEDIDEAACCRQWNTHNWGISHSCHCFTPLRKILIRFMAHTSKLKGNFKVVSSVPCRRME